MKVIKIEMELHFINPYNISKLDQSKFKLLYGIEIMDEQTDKHISHNKNASVWTTHYILKLAYLTLRVRIMVFNTTLNYISAM